MAQAWTEDQKLDAASGAIGGGLGIVGAGLSAIPGVGPILGAGVAGAGMLTSQFLQMFKKPPKLPGPTGAQMVNLERSNTLAEQTAQMQGLSPAEVANLDELTARSSIRSQAVVNAYNSVYQMSPLEQEVLVKSVVTQQQEEAARVRREFFNMDAEAVRRSVSAKIAANEQAAARANEIAQIERQNEMIRLDMEAQKYANLGEVLGDVGGIIGESIRYTEGKKKALEKEYQEKTTDFNKRSTGGGMITDMARKYGGGTIDVSDTVTGVETNPLMLDEKGTNAARLQEARMDSFWNKEADLYRQAQEEARLYRGQEKIRGRAQLDLPIG